MFERKDKSCISVIRPYFFIHLNLSLILLTSFEQQLFRYHQMIFKGTCSVIEYNIIKPGLNFLVPNEWYALQEHRWAEFVRKNKNVQNWDDIITPHEHPLNMLFELGMLYLPNLHNEGDLVRFETKAQNIALNLSKAFQHLKREKIMDRDSQSIQQALQILNFSKIQETIMKVLLCPQVDNNQIKQLMFDTFQWKIVTPLIYKVISQNVQCKIGNQYIKNVIGVPIFLDQCTELQDFTNKSYTIGAQIQANIYISNPSGVKYSLIGYIQQKMTYEEIMRHLYEGLNNLMNREWLNSNYFTQRSFMVVNNEQIYENFMAKEGEVRRILKEQINLKNWYDNFSSEIPSKKFEIFQFAGQIRKNQYSFKRLNQNNKETYDNMEPSKKIKQNQSQIAGYVQVYSRTKGFQPTIIQQSDARQRQSNENYYSISQNIAQLIKSAKPKKQNHSSTEEDTPGSAIIQDSIQNEMKRISYKDESRINFPLLKSEHNQQALIKLAQVRMNDHISLPFSGNNSLMRKLQSGARVFLGGSTNLLSINSEGQTVEEQNSNIQDVISTAFLTTSKLLEDLALEVVGIKEQVTSQVKNESLLAEPSREKINMRTEACRNEIVDELDEVQSQEC